jgi:hypothetical protein
MKGGYRMVSRIPARPGFVTTTSVVISFSLITAALMLFAFRTPNGDAADAFTLRASSIVHEMPAAASIIGVDSEVERAVKKLAMASRGEFTPDDIYRSCGALLRQSAASTASHKETIHRLSELRQQARARTEN